MKVKSSWRPERVLPSPDPSLETQPVPLSRLPGIQQLRIQRFKVGSSLQLCSDPSASPAPPLVLMTGNPQQPPAYFWPPFSHGSCLHQRATKSTFPGWEIRTRRVGDNGESCSLGLFRFSLGARLDTTSEWTKGGTTHSSSQGLRVFGLRVLE